MSTRATGWVATLLEEIGHQPGYETPLALRALARAVGSDPAMSPDEQLWRVSLYRDVRALAERDEGMALWRDTTPAPWPRGFLSARVRSRLRAEGWRALPVRLTRARRRKAA